MTYDEELTLHKTPIHFSDYLQLPVSERQSSNIYFIDDIISDTELIEKLIEKIDELTQRLTTAGLIE